MIEDSFDTFKSPEFDHYWEFYRLDRFSLLDRFNDIDYHAWEYYYDFINCEQ
jgi:hypothetical protein